MITYRMVEVEKEFQGFYGEVFYVLPYHGLVLSVTTSRHTNSFKNRARCAEAGKVGCYLIINPPHQQ